MPQFKMSPRFRAPGGEPLAAGQSSNTVSGTTKFYNKHAAGNAMASILGQENVPNQQFGGAFNQASASFGGAQQSGAYDEPEYPLPGSSASCDSCGEVINDYYHCIDCKEETGLFDLCKACSVGIYMKGTIQKVQHPTHDYGTHRMAKTAPAPGQ